MRVSESKVAVVTGANRGIGKEVCRQLADAGLAVVLTARSQEKAEMAAAELASQALIPKRLDVSITDSIAEFSEWLTAEFGKLDVLVNNAAIHYDTWQRVTNAGIQSIEEAYQTNVFGPWQICQRLTPLLRKSQSPRIVNVSSGAGAMDSLSGSTPVYSMTKVSLNALTMMFASELRQDGILVNAVCPGWVATDMGGSGGRPVAEGARGIVWAATLPDGGPTGQIFRDGKPISW